MNIQSNLSDSEDGFESSIREYKIVCLDADTQSCTFASCRGTFGDFLLMESVEVKNTKRIERTRTAPKEERRQQLIDATIEAISRYGISHTTMTKVTDIAGLSLGLVNFHFTNKQNLFEETLRYLSEEHRSQWRRSMDTPRLRPEDKINAIVDAHFHPRICTHQKLAVWFAFYGEAGTRSAYRENTSSIDAERWQVSAALLQEIIIDADSRALCGEQIAETLEALYDGFWLNILIYPHRFTAEHAKWLIRSHLHQILPTRFDFPVAYSQKGVSYAS